MKTLEAIFAASVKQLKSLIITYGAEGKSAAYSVFWHPGLLYVVNVVLKDLSDNKWKAYFEFCIRAYCKLFSTFQFATGLARGLLGMALLKGAIRHEEALMLDNELRQNALPRTSLKTLCKGSLWIST